MENQSRTAVEWLLEFKMADTIKDAEKLVKDGRLLINGLVAELKIKYYNPKRFYIKKG